jgi:hypothetical protein
MVAPRLYLPVEAASRAAMCFYDCVCASTLLPHRGCLPCYHVAPCMWFCPGSASLHPTLLEQNLSFFMLPIALSKHVKIVTLTNPLYIYKDNPLWVLNSNSLRMKICHLITWFVSHINSWLDSLSISLSFSLVYSICSNHPSATQEVVCLSPDVMLFCNKVLFFTYQCHIFMRSATTTPMHISNPYIWAIIQLFFVHLYTILLLLLIPYTSKEAPSSSTYHFCPATEPQDHSHILDDLATTILQNFTPVNAPPWPSHHIWESLQEESHCSINSIFVILYIILVLVLFSKP